MIMKQKDIGNLQKNNTTEDLDMEKQVEIKNNRIISNSTPQKKEGTMDVVYTGTMDNAALMIPVVISMLSLHIAFSKITAAENIHTDISMLVIIFYLHAPALGEQDEYKTKHKN